MLWPFLKVGPIETKRRLIACGFEAIWIKYRCPFLLKFEILVDRLPSSYINAIRFTY